MIVELEPVEVAEITGFVNAKNDGFHEAIEPSEHLPRRDFDEIPRPDRVLHGLEHRVLADPLFATENERVVNLFLRTLHPLREPLNDVIGVVREDLTHMSE